jgi:uncharacterized RDD family membrane protein YckC
MLDVIVVAAIFNIISPPSEELKHNSVFVFGHVNLAANGGIAVIFFLAYSVVLTSLVGQTPGMLIAGLRLVRTDFGRVGFGQALWRYLLLLLLFWYIAPLSPFSRVFASDKWSGTRLIKTERVLARAATA